MGVYFVSLFLGGILTKKEIARCEKDPTASTEEALAVVYQLIRSSEPPNLETAQKFIERIYYHLH